MFCTKGKFTNYLPYYSKSCAIFLIIRSNCILFDLLC